MNGDRAEKQFKRIGTMLKESGSKCSIERVPGEADSVHATFHCGKQRHSVAWVGAWLETLDENELWRQLDLATRGAIRRPAA
jgi:hypothetical protein